MARRDRVAGGRAPERRVGTTFPDDNPSSGMHRLLASAEPPGADDRDLAQQQEARCLRDKPETISALSAAAWAPVMTEVTPMEVYVAGKTPGDLRRALFAAGLEEMEDGTRGEDAADHLREEISRG